MMEFDVTVEGVELPNVYAAIRNESADAVAGAAEFLYSRVLSRSPVRTGKFRANWTVGVNSADRSTTDSTAFNVNKTSNLTLQPGDEVIIGNWLPYEPVIEFGLYGPGPNTVGGYSKQAVGGVLGPAIDDLIAYMGSRL